MRRALVSVLLGLWVLPAGAAVGGCSSRGSDAAPRLPLPDVLDAGTSADAQEPFPVLASFFDVEARIGPAGVSGGRYPETFRFTLALNASQTRVVIGVAGRYALFRRRSPWVEGGINFRLGDTPACPQNIDAVLEFSNPTLALEDTTRDGIADRVSGAMRGRVNTHDASDSVDIMYAGARDERPPSLTARWSTPANPSDMFFIDATEPLPLGLGLRLVGDSGEPSFELTPIPLEGDLISTWGRGYPLPFGGAWHVEVTPELRDLAGNVGRVPDGVVLRTAPDPGVFAEDGFEGPLAALTTGRAWVVDATTIAPIDGAHSLLLLPADGTEAGGRVTFRIHAPPGSHVVRWSYRALTTTTESPYLSASFAGPFAGVLSWNAPGGTEPSGLDAPPLIGAVGEIAGVELNGEELLLGFATAGSCGGASASPGVGLLLDDLRVE